MVEKPALSQISNPDFSIYSEVPDLSSQISNLS